MSHNKSEAIATIRAWWALEEAFDAFNAGLRRTHGVTGGQLALLRIISEREPVTIRELRRDLNWHPASLGQRVQRLVDRGLLFCEPSVTDRRIRTLTISDAGQTLLQSAPLVGPVRLRQVDLAADDLTVMRRGFETALEAFALAPSSHDD